MASVSSRMQITLTLKDVFEEWQEPDGQLDADYKQLGEYVAAHREDAERRERELERITSVYHQLQQPPAHESRDLAVALTLGNPPAESVRKWAYVRTEGVNLIPTFIQNGAAISLAAGQSIALIREGSPVTQEAISGFGFRFDEIKTQAMAKVHPDSETRPISLNAQVIERNGELNVVLR